MTTLIKAVLLGSAFGFALYAAGASRRSNIRAMLRLESLELMKTILFGIGFAAFLIGLSVWAGYFDGSHFSVKAMNGGVLLGGLIFGVGFGFSGCCPGTSLAALPLGHRAKTFGLVAGGLAGAFAFSLSYSWWKGLGLFRVMDLGKITLFGVSSRFSSVFSAGPIGLAGLGILFMIAALAVPRKLRGPSCEADGGAAAKK